MLYQIIGLTVGGVLLFSAVLWTSVISVIDEMNRKSFNDSVAAVESRVSSLKEQVRLITSDYNNWNDVYWAVENEDIQFISDNYGITAARGDVFEYAVIFDGPFRQPIAWSAGRRAQPRRMLPSLGCPGKDPRGIGTSADRLSQHLRFRGRGQRRTGDVQRIAAAARGCVEGARHADLEFPRLRHRQDPEAVKARRRCA
ncbi:hypothetical protein [Paenirhodobacter sp.]|uniref:hypothetical protein n=1 Tax=Paenirhodobacter sp. TaxID=1965326 RepID=UPI003B3E978D